MNELVITNNKGTNITTSMIVAEIFGKEHRRVLQDIRDLHCSPQFHELNFVLSFIIRQLPNNGSKEDSFYEITKDGFSFLVMGYTGEKAARFKEDFINAFNKNESLLKNPDYILAQAQQILFDRIKSIENQLHQKDERLALQEHEIKTAAPKVEYYDSVLQAEGLIPANVIAKELGMSAVTLNKLLHQKGIIYRSGETWVLYNKYQNKGFTKTKTHSYTDSHGNNASAIHTYYTEKGREFIHSLLKSEKRA